MINYKQILEAVNRGIKFAMSDLEDDEELSSISKLKTGLIENKNYTRELLDLKKEVVDLGLPSGTLWCKYNLGVDPNELSKLGEWYGDYYAWGELESNKLIIYYDWNNYKFGNELNLTKYCNNHTYGLNHFTDNLTELLPEDDAAYQFKKCHNYKFHMPTEELCEELIKYTTNYWVNNYDPNKLKHNLEDDKGIKGLNGRVFEGKNGNLFFIPAAGFYDDAGHQFGGSYCSLWSRSLDISTSRKAYGLNFGAVKISTSPNNRYYGYSIRPVINL